MSEKQLQKIADEFEILERKCQAGEDIEKNQQQMEQLLMQCDLFDILKLSAKLEKIFPNQVLTI